MHDVIVIGKGPAGISAAIYALRAGLKTLIVSNGYGALEKAEKVDNFFGFSKSISGIELLKEGIEQAKRLGAEFADDEIISINPYEDIELKGFTGSYKAVCLIMAVGKSRKKLKIENLDKLEGRGVSYCTSCDGFFYREKKVALLGYNDYMAHEANELMAFTKDITVITNGKDLEVSLDSVKDIRVEGRKLKKILGDESFEGVMYDDGETEEFDGLFVAYESPGGSGLALKAGIMTADGDIVTDKDQRTNINNIFAAGDCTGGFLQVSTAVGEGALAAKSAIAYVREYKQRK